MSYTLIPYIENYLNIDLETVSSIQNQWESQIWQRINRNKKFEVSDFFLCIETKYKRPGGL